MKNSLTLLIGLLVVLVLLAYMFSFQVGYDEVAVVTTFGQARAPSTAGPGQAPSARETQRRATNPDSVIENAGLHWRWPWPIQQVREYSTRLRLLEGQLTELQTADNKSIIVRTYVIWRIDDPYSFYATIGTPQAARQQISNLMSNLTGVVSRYRLNELVNRDINQLKLRSLEQRYTQALRDELGQFDRGLGVAVEEVGIRRILLPEAITQTVFEQMKTTRQRLAQEIISTGQARAEAIRSEAESARQIILNFAQARAARIKAEGDQAAAQYLQNFSENPRLAIFLRRLEAMKKMLSHQTTFILDANKLAMLDMFAGSQGKQEKAPPPNQPDQPDQSNQGRQPRPEPSPSAMLPDRHGLNSAPSPPSDPGSRQTSASPRKPSSRKPDKIPNSGSQSAP